MPVPRISSIWRREGLKVPQKQPKRGQLLAEQLSILARAGCAAIQGYLIGKPSRSLASPDQVRRLMLLALQAVENDVAFN